MLGWRGWSVEGAVYLNTRGSIPEEDLGSKLPADGREGGGGGGDQIPFKHFQGVCVLNPL